MRAEANARRGPFFALAGAALLLLLAAGAWWITRAGPRGAAPVESTRELPRAVTPDSATTTGANDSPNRAPEPAYASPSVAAAEQLARELGLELATGTADGPLLIAVEKAGGRPLAGVLMIVHEYRPNPSRVMAATPPLPPHRLDFLRVHGSSTRQPTYVTGDDGRVRVQRLVANSLLVAYHPAFHGSLWLRDDAASEVRVELQPTKLLRVRVVDSDARSRAGVPVEVTEPTKAKDRISSAHRSNEEGLVELHPFEAAPPMRWNLPVVRVALAIPLAESAPGVERLIDRDHLPEEPIELIVPPTGRVAIRVVDGAGALLPDANGWFRAGIVEADDRRTPSEQIARSRGSHGLLPLNRGECELAPVGLGLSFEVGAYSIGHDGPSRVLAGPRSDGERVEVDLPLATKVPTISGRLVDGAGKPWASSPVKLHFLAVDSGAFPSDRDGERGCTTDAAGRFRTDRPGPSRAPALLRFTVLDERMAWSGRGERRIDAGSAESLELGDVLVEPLSVLAAGIVVDRAGTPVEAVEITVHARSRGLWRGLDGFRLVFGLGTVSDADGRFEIRGPLGEEELLLEANAKFKLASACSKATPGERDVRIVLKRERQLDVVTLVDQGIPPAAIRLQFREQESDPWRFSLPLAENGTVSLRPGDLASVDVRFIAFGLEREPIELLVVRGVMLAEDAPTRDPRLDPADLRGRLVATRLLVRDGEGHPVTDARATLWREPRDGATDPAFVAPAAARNDDLAATRWRGSPTAFDADPDGVLSVVAARVGLPLLIEAPGFLPRRVETTAGERDVVLERAGYVLLEIAEAWLIDQLPFHLRASLTPERDGAAAMPTRALRNGYALDAPVGHAGRYRLRVTIARLLDDGRLLERDLAPTPAVIDVTDPPTRLPIEVHVDPQALRRLDSTDDPSR